MATLSAPPAHAWLAPQPRSLMALTAAEIVDIRRYAQKLADQAPPLTPKQRDRLQALLPRKQTQPKPIAA